MALLRDGEIELVEWVEEMKAEIKSLHVSSAVIGRGGLEEMTPEDWEAVEAELLEQYDYLRGMVDELVANDGQDLGPRWDWRAILYGGAAWGTFNQSELAWMEAEGMTEYQWTLGYADHCASCVDYASYGWVPLGMFPGVPADGTSTLCGTNCHCHLEYREGTE